MIRNNYKNELFIDDRETKRNFVRKFTTDVSIKISEMQKKTLRILNLLFVFLLCFCIIHTFLFNYYTILLTAVIYLIVALVLNIKIFSYNLKLEKFNHNFRRYNMINLDLFNF